ncbi:Gcd14p [Sugiyamaella lignohabitans]|uniref:tRNA (adenine(58)-N(1))-methyltransferase catalytic subunit TRM61 n=1 Tax=Sugiyamaella lignohabitans TaxID=796027 RepID=A0A167FWG3_9ASCO|nr:Gcd14p [Sugiyamaella lignohabitans]ANB15788.1 Gcd14p [Sugiyamaella lignohabitans]
MSFLDNRDIIQEGDLVLAWISRGDVKPITVRKEQQLNTRFGIFPHNLIIGQKFGNQIPSVSGKGFIHLVAPTPELWTLSLPHRTQIVYTPDSSYIVQRLKIRPGSRVIEAGTGSGSFTHAISRSVDKRGHIFTYEFHEPRFLEAKKEIEDHGLADIVSITHRDVCNEGFENPMDYSGDMNASAVFLDLPSPWTAIPRLKSCLATDRVVSICCFSPCMEQVIKTVETLRKEGFQRIEMVEISSKRWEGHRNMVRNLDDALQRLKDVKERRLYGLEIRKEKNDAAKKRKIEDSVGNASHRDSAVESSVSPVATPSETTSEAVLLESVKHNSSQNSSYKGYNPWGRGLRIREGDPNYEWRSVSRMEAEIKSHTSYLTFAILPPKFELPNNE